MSVCVSRAWRHHPWSHHLPGCRRMCTCCSTGMGSPPASGRSRRVGRHWGWPRGWRVGAAVVGAPFATQRRWTPKATGGRQRWDHGCPCSGLLLRGVGHGVAWHHKRWPIALQQHNRSINPQVQPRFLPGRRAMQERSMAIA